jgi:phosphoribosylglycinamide formyltransferase-1
MLKIGVLVSGGGTNLQAIMDYMDKNKVDAEIVTVVSNRSKAYALERASKRGIEAVFISKKEAGSQEAYEQKLIDHFNERKADLIILAGFMVVLSEKFVNAFENRIINIHPALIPSFCGDGFYGIKVHEAVLEAGVKVTGATVHFVTAETDAGPIILQKAVEVKQDDTPEVLQKRVMEEAEWIIYPLAVKLIAEGRVEIKENKVYIRE